MTALPLCNAGVLLRLCTLGLFSFWDTVLRYFLKSIPPPPFWAGSVEEPEASAAAEDEAAAVVLAALEDGARAANSDPGGSDRALLKGFFLLPPVLFSGFAASPLFPLDGFLSPGSSLRALRQFCILFHLLVEAFWILSMVDVEEAGASSPSFTSSSVPLEPVCHLYVLRGSLVSGVCPWGASTGDSFSFSGDPGSFSTGSESFSSEPISTFLCDSNFASPLKDASNRIKMWAHWDWTFPCSTVLNKAFCVELDSAVLPSLVVLLSFPVLQNVIRQQHAAPSVVAVLQLLSLTGCLLPHEMSQRSSPIYRSLPIFVSSLYVLLDTSHLI